MGDFLVFIKGLILESGISPTGALLMAGMAVLIWRSWRRQTEVESRQTELHTRIDAELIRLSAAHEACQRQLREALWTNAELDRWKAVCEDACSESVRVHKLKLTKLDH